MDETDAGPVTNDEPDILGFSFKCFRSGNKNSKEYVKAVVDKSALFYKMDHKYRGVAVLFNHETFTVPNLSNRNGTNADLANLDRTLTRMGFKVYAYQDLKTEEVMRRVAEHSSADYSDHDCFLMCVLTHGEEGILFSKDSAYKHENLWKPFTADKCKTLAGKPKLFFIQACQGNQLDPGLSMRTQTDSAASYKIPIHADFLIAYSTLPGFYSWRNTSRGSWFVQALCSVLEEFAYTYDLLTLMTFVNLRVATDFESYVPSDKVMNAQKQIPWITFMLTRLVKFTPPKEEQSEV